MATTWKPKAKFTDLSKFVQAKIWKKAALATPEIKVYTFRIRLAKVSFPGENVSKPPMIHPTFKPTPALVDALKDHVTLMKTCRMSRHVYMKAIIDDPDVPIYLLKICYPPTKGGEPQEVSIPFNHHAFFAIRGLMQEMDAINYVVSPYSTYGFDSIADKLRNLCIISFAAKIRKVTFVVEKGDIGDIDEGGQEDIQDFCKMGSLLSLRFPNAMYFSITHSTYLQGPDLPQKHFPVPLHYIRGERVQLTGPSALDKFKRTFVASAFDPK